MILSGEDIKRYDLLLDADPKNMQAQGWDVRLDKVYRVVNKPYGEKIKEEVDYVGPYKILVEDFNKTWGNSGLCNYICQIWNKDGILSYYIPPNFSVLFKLMETVDLRPRREYCQGSLENIGYFNAYVLPKSSLSRRGVIVHSAWWDAGYKGSGVVLVRTSEVPLQIKPGDAFGQMIFYEGSSTGSVYNGQYQGEGLAGRKV